MLTIYRDLKDIPEGIRYVEDNDIFFNGNTMLDDRSFSKNILKDIDGAEYVSEDVFLGRNKELGGLFRILLSTGTKTLLNILSHNNMCFNVVECGVNALEWIPKISVYVENASILWKDCCFLFSENYDCDIMYKGKRYFKAVDFVEDVYKE